MKLYHSPVNLGSSAVFANSNHHVCVHIFRTQGTCCNRGEWLDHVADTLRKRGGDTTLCRSWPLIGRREMIRWWFCVRLIRQILNGPTTYYSAGRNSRNYERLLLFLIGRLHAYNWLWSIATHQQRPLKTMLCLRWGLWHRRVLCLPPVSCTAIAVTYDKPNIPVPKHQSYKFIQHYISWYEPWNFPGMPQQELFPNLMPVSPLIFWLMCFCISNTGYMTLNAGSDSAPKGYFHITWATSLPENSVCPLITRFHIKFRNCKSQWGRITRGIGACTSSCDTVNSSWIFF